MMKEKMFISIKILRKTKNNYFNTSNVKSIKFKKRIKSQYMHPQITITLIKNYLILNQDKEI
jgi:hypothetical protein